MAHTSESRVKGILNRRVRISVSEPFEFSSPKGGASLWGKVRAISSDFSEGGCLWIELDEGIEWEGMRSAHVLASPRHEESEIGELLTEGMLIVNIGLVPNEIIAKLPASPLPTDIRELYELAGRGSSIPFAFVGAVFLAKP
jgi:hypothetical protein